VEIPASKVVKENNKNEMSKTFFIFSLHQFILNPTSRDCFWTEDFSE